MSRERSRTAGTLGEMILKGLNNKVIRLNKVSMSGFVKFFVLLSLVFICKTSFIGFTYGNCLKETEPYKMDDELYLIRSLQYEIDGQIILNDSESVDYVNRYYRTMVPFRFFFEELGYDVEWIQLDDGEFKIIANRNNSIEDEISLTDATNEPIVNKNKENEKSYTFDFNELLKLGFTLAITFSLSVNFKYIESKEKYYAFMSIVLVCFVYFSKDIIIIIIENLNKNVMTILKYLFVLILLTIFFFILQFIINKLIVLRIKNGLIFLDEIKNLEVDNEILIIEKEISYIVNSKEFLSNYVNLIFQNNKNENNFSGSLGHYKVTLVKFDLIQSVEFDIKLKSMYKPYKIMKYNNSTVRIEFLVDSRKLVENNELRKMIKNNIEYKDDFQNNFA